MYAVIRTGGKQYKVAPEDTLQIEKIEGKEGDTVAFSEVLMIGGEGEPAFGTPTVVGATVSAEVVEQGRGPKIIVFKKKRRQNYRRKKGHRQDLTTVRILEILTAGKKPKGAKPAKAAAKLSPSEAEATEAAPKRARKAEASANTTAEAAEAPKKARAKAKQAPAAEAASDQPAAEAKKPRARKPKAED